MATRYAYVPAKRSNVGSALSALFAGLERDDSRFNRAANFNVIVPLSRRTLLDAVEDDIDALSVSHPSRFFVLYLDDALAEIEVSVSARCQSLSKSEHVCSEIVRIGAPVKQLTAVPSLIRANLLTGMPSEFYLYDPAFGIDLLRPLATLADSTILDSADFEGRETALAEVSRLTRSVLDLQWVALGIWRDEIKDLFGRPIVREYLETIRSVTITSQSAGGRADSAPALLLASWIANRLGLTARLVPVQDGFECSGASGRSVRINLHAVAEPGASSIREVLFRFEPLRIGPEPQDQFIRLSRADVLSSTVELRASFRATRPFDDESRKGRIQRFFLIGESMANYTAAARLSHEFGLLKKTR